MYKLIIEDDEGKTTVVPLIRDEITIGRKEGNTIRLTERNVSRKHARLVKQNGHVFIEDVSSYNGIKLNGDRIDGRANVGEGDRIQIGDYQLALKLDKAANAPQNGAAAGAPGAPVATGPGEDKTTPYSKDSAVPTQMIEAPTLMNPVVPAKAEGTARLVVTSSNFAGQEFVLDKAAVVIGRTDENDVVVNHRSISRHHAKVVRENGHYHVVDLQSANGVRVNGEEYGKVELRRGDHIDLGHVRLRFVAPGEDFVFERDAQVVDVAGSGSKSGIVLAIIAVVLIGGGLAAWRIAGTGGPTPPTAKTGDNDAQVNKLLMDADRAAKAEEWELAIGKCDEALKIDPTQELARDKRQRAEAERKNRSAYQRFTAAAEKADDESLDSAVTAFGEIAEDSIYRQRGTEAYARVKKAFVRMHLEKARTAKQASQCDVARQHVEAVMTVDESNQEALDLVKSCGTQVAVRPTPPRPPPERPERPERPPVAKVERPRPTPQAKPPEPKQPPEDTDTPPQPGHDLAGAEHALQEAKDAYVHGKYAEAIETAKKALKAQPKEAWRLIGASYCFLKDRGGAVTAFGKLDPQGKQFLKYVCSRNSINVP